MNMISLFTGIGAFERGLDIAGIQYQLKGFSEIDKYAIESYCAIHDVDKSLNLGDVSKIPNKDLPTDIDLLTYGFPCQDISVAGDLKGINSNTRSGLLYEAERIIDYIKPKYAIAENVKNLVSKRFKDDFDRLLERLDSYGYNNYWKVLNAKDYGIPQNRERVFIVSIRKDVDDGLFEFPDGRDLAIRLKDVLLDDVEEKYYIDNDRSKELISKLDDVETSESKIVASRGRNPDNPSDRTVGNYTEQRLEVNDQGVTNTLTTVQKDNLVLEPKRLGGLFDTETSKRQAGAVWDKDCIAPTIDTCKGGYREPIILEPKVAVKEATEQGYAVAGVGDSINISFPNSKTRRGRVGYGVAQTFNTNELDPGDTINPFNRTVDKSGSCPTLTTRPEGFKTAILPITLDYRLRKLTPLECFRLMGFSDDCYWKARLALENSFYNGKDRSNSQMYKQAGNSIVVNVLVDIYLKLFNRSDLK